jgi:hypothetical protein
MCEARARLHSRSDRRQRRKLQFQGRLIPVYEEAHRLAAIYPEAGMSESEIADEFRRRGLNEASSPDA